MNFHPVIENKKTVEVSVTSRNAIISLKYCHFDDWPVLDIQPFVNLKGINASRIPDASHSLYGLLSPSRLCTLTPRYTSVLGGGSMSKESGEPRVVVYLQCFCESTRSLSEKV